MRTDLTSHCHQLSCCLSLPLPNLEADGVPAGARTTTMELVTANKERGQYGSGVSQLSHQECQHKISEARYLKRTCYWVRWCPSGVSGIAEYRPVPLLPACLAGLPSSLPGLPTNSPTVPLAEPQVLFSCSFSTGKHIVKIGKISEIGLTGDGTRLP